MLHRLRDAVPGSCGGKASGLGALLRAGLHVPDGFVVPFEVYRAETSNPRSAVHGLREAITRGLEELGDVPVAVRSSADTEDTPGASAAGQHESFLGVRGIGPVISAMEACWESLNSERPVSYRAAQGVCAAVSESGAMAVLVQRLVDAEISGVMFTPTTTSGGTRIEATWGLGAAVVGGTVTPDAFQVDEDGAVTKVVSDKQTRVDRDRARLITSEVSTASRGIACVDDETAVRLAQLGQEIAALLGAPQDIEWAIAGGQIWILQARPITAALPSFPRTATKYGIPSILVGVAGSPGHVTGRARIVRGPSDFARIRSGDILVCPYTDPAWTPLLNIAGGVVTETGGALSHAAIVARELRIPAVLGVTGATEQLREGAMITLNGEAGTITIART